MADSIKLSYVFLLMTRLNWEKTLRVEVEVGFGQSLNLPSLDVGFRRSLNHPGLYIGRRECAFFRVVIICGVLVAVVCIVSVCCFGSSFSFGRIDERINELIEVFVVIFSVSQFTTGVADPTNASGQ